MIINWSRTFKSCESLYCTPVTYVILDINYISMKKLFRDFFTEGICICIIHTLFSLGIYYLQSLQGWWDYTLPVLPSLWAFFGTARKHKIIWHGKQKQVVEGGSESHSVVSNSLWPHGLEFSRPKYWSTGAGRLSLLQRIFPSQESNPGLLHCRQILYQLTIRKALRVEG